MNSRKIAYILLTFLLISHASFTQVRIITELNNEWKFLKGKSDLAFQKDFDDSNWDTVTVPHDWAIYCPFDKEIDKQTVAIVQNNEKIATEKTGRTGALPYTGEGWYRNQFNLPHYKEGQKVLVVFEGAMSEPTVFLNGKKIGEWGYGYSYFYFDITNHVSAGKKNTLAVQLTNRAMSSRWYPGAGLYRKVRIVVKNKESIDQWGTFITTPFITSDLAKVNVKTKVSGENVRMVTHILNANGDTIASDKAQTIFGDEFEQNIAVLDPKLWSPETPYLYTAISQLYVGKTLKDEVTTRFGIREIKYEPNTLT